MKLVPAFGLVGEAALREAAATELRQVMGLVQAALATKAGMSYMPIEAMYPDRVIACKDGRYYSYPYSIGADNQVTLGEASEVVEDYVPVRVVEGVEAFLEAVDKEGRVWDVIIIKAGLSGNGNYYPDSALREAAPLFDGAKVLARSDDEHIQGKGKDVRNIVGWLSNPRFVEGKKTDGGQLMSRLNFTAGPVATALREAVTDAWQHGKKDLVGLSIDARAQTVRRVVESKPVRYAQKFIKVSSVDLIVEPGAGGALVRLVEAAPDISQESDPMKERMLATIKAKAPAIFAKIDPAKITEEELEQRYAEALAHDAAEQTRLAEAARQQQQQNSPATLTQEQVDERIRMSEVRAGMRVTIAHSGLPEAAQTRLVEAFAARAAFVDADVAKAIKDERVYIARFSESGKVQLDDKGDIVVEDRPAKMRDMLDAFFDPAHKEHRRVRSFRECYIEITGDKEFSGRPDRARLAESLGVELRESLDTTSFAYTLGDSITRRLIADYNTQSQYDAWKPLVNTVPVNDFRTQERTRFGGYGNLATVAQGAPYPAMSSPTDEHATYSLSKRGGTEDITLEMIANDDVGSLRQIPTKLSRAAKRTLGQFVFDFIATNPTLYDSVAFFHASHGNLGSSALDATQLAAARLRMLKQTEAGSSARLGIGPKFLIVPVDLQETAVNLFNRNTNLDKTFVQDMTLPIIPVWYWTDTNDWAIAADPVDIPSIEIGFFNGNQEPELFVQDMPNVGSMFNNDKLTYKLRHIYSGNVVNYRGFDKSVV